MRSKLPWSSPMHGLIAGLGTYENRGWLAILTLVFHPQARRTTNFFLGLGAECGQAQQADINDKQRSK